MPTLTTSFEGVFAVELAADVDQATRRTGQATVRIGSRLSLGVGADTLLVIRTLAYERG